VDDLRLAVAVDVTDDGRAEDDLVHHLGETGDLGRRRPVVEDRARNAGIAVDVGLRRVPAQDVQGAAVGSIEGGSIEVSVDPDDDVRLAVAVDVVERR
jgi:hypothetical protein